MSCGSLNPAGSASPFFINLKKLPYELNREIWAASFRLFAEQHGDAFIDVHDELTDYTIKVTIADKYILKLCRANKYYSLIDIDDLWFNRYIYKHVIETQVKCDCLRLLEKFRGRSVKQPTARFGDVIITLGTAYVRGRTLGYYLDKIPGPRDYAEDLNHYSRRYRGDLELLDYACSNAAISAALMGSLNSSVSSIGRGVSARTMGFGADGFDSGTNFGLSSAGDSTSETDADESDDDEPLALADAADWNSFMAEAAMAVQEANASLADADAEAATDPPNSTVGGEATGDT
jgi:hypothetical protein